ncbi:MAG: ComEC/Rec2 family competence protein [Syntrophomonadaceae bacterium]
MRLEGGDKKNRSRKRRRKWIIGLVLTGAIISGPSAPSLNQEPVKVHFIDVGQGDAIYIQLPEHNDILIDAGDADYGDDVVNYLKAQGMDKLELLVATHPHEDHIGGLPEVMAAFQVDQVIDSGLAVQSQCYELYRQAAEAELCTWLADDHQVFDFAGAQLQILTGDEIWSDVNDYSVVARLDCGDVEFLFMGDAEKEAEACLPGDISAEILKVGHHGSSTSTSREFLNRVDPQVAVISVMEDNAYGLPDLNILAMLHNCGAEIFRTDIRGSIVITTDGKRQHIRSGRIKQVYSLGMKISHSRLANLPLTKNRQNAEIFFLYKDRQYCKQTLQVCCPLSKMCLE